MAQYIDTLRPDAPMVGGAAAGVGQEEPAVDNCRGPSLKRRAHCASDLEILDEFEIAKNRRIELKFGHFSGNAAPSASER